MIKRIKCSLTDVIIKCFVVEFLVEPIFLNLENLLAAGNLFPECSSQNHLQSFSLDTESSDRSMCV